MNDIPQATQAIKDIDSSIPSAGAPDLTLVLARLEKAILRGEEPAKVRNALGNDALWRRAPAEIMLKRARLAQMAGEAEIALSVLEVIHADKPEAVDAWTAHIDLLSILDDRTHLAQVLASARPHIGEEEYHAWIRGLKPGKNIDPDADVAAATMPFEKLHRDRELVNNYLKLFSGREDCFARQWVDQNENRQGYVPVHRAMEYQDVEDHLSGRRTYGIYLLTGAGNVNTAVMDVDLQKKYRQGKPTSADRDLIRREHQYLFSRIKELAGQMGVTPIAEFSGGKGFHFWFFFTPSASAALARKSLEHIRQSISGDLTAFALEVFPKQDAATGKGLGNLVKLPLGVHRLTGKASFFTGCQNRSKDAQLTFLMNVRPADPARLQAVPEKTADVLVHPRWQKWAEKYPELSNLERCCPPLGQIIALCRGGNAISTREEKIIYQTIGFLANGRSLIHHLLSGAEDFNPHLVDYRLSRLRGSPLGCRRIHSLLNFAGDLCAFDVKWEYHHPLLHLENWQMAKMPKAEKVENLSGAIENLKLALSHVERFLT
ncbi:MAG: CRISPR-associated primase-polymerase type A1 [Desulfobacterales bacterium]|nr:CRISPR-associated primase-polymerase type A1 [Desulfobacterales bacterium]